MKKELMIVIIVSAIVLVAILIGSTLVPTGNAITYIHSERQSIICDDPDDGHLPPKGQAFIYGETIRTSTRNGDITIFKDECLRETDRKTKLTEWTCGPNGPQKLILRVNGCRGGEALA